MQKLKVSVVIPTYNRKICVMDAVNSVLAQESSEVAFEVIVSDDGSTDGTKELFKKKIPNVHYLYSSRNAGVNAARNRAIRKATGEYVLLLDSDDKLSPQAASTLASARSKLGKVNFFGTADVKSTKKLYTVSKEGSITYKDWLEKKKLKGEFDPVVHKSVFKQALFDEERFCFEGFFWNRAIKKNGLMVFDKVIRLYSFEQENRVSKKLLLPANAAKRYDDYQRYVKEFGGDYKELQLERAFAEILKTLSVYAMLAGKADVARESNREAIKLHTTPDKILLQTAFFFGKRFFRSLYSVALKFIS